MRCFNFSYFTKSEMFNLRCKYSVKSLYFVHNLQHLQLYSTSTNGFNQTFTDYLVNDLGFSQQQALSTSTKPQIRNVNYSKLPGNANSVVNFLKQNDFDDTHLRKIVSLHPRILFSKVDKTLKPKFQLLQDLGFSGSNLITVFSYNPTFGANRMNDIISNLRTLLGTDENLIKFFGHSSLYSTSGGLENLILNVELLKNEYGINIEDIRNSILVLPRPFLRNTEFFRSVVVRVKEELGIPCDSKMFFYGICLLSWYSKKGIESKCQLFKSFGWTEYQISDLMRRNPNTFMSSEENIRKKLDFLVNELDYKPDFLVSHSAFFTYSLEKRLVPRHRVLFILKEKGLLDYNFYNASKKAETEFLRVVVEPFQDVLPGLLEIYQSSK